MKKFVSRITHVLNNKKGETIVEVVVAFALLAIMLLIFSQGLASATRTEMYASENRKKADESMNALQEKLATTKPEGGAPIISPKDPQKPDEPGKVLPIKRYIYTIDDETDYVVYEFG